MNFWNNLHPLLRRDQDDYGSANYAVLNALADSLSDAEQDTISKKVQLQFSTATGSYLDEWGSWFGVARRASEDDDTYRERIKYYFLIPRSTIEGIIRGIQYYLDDTNAHISIYEPWKNIFYLNKSNLNSEDHLHGYYYRYGVINVNIDRPMSQAIYDAIQAFKPAGVKFYVTINPAYSADTTTEVLAELQARNMNIITQKYGFTYASKIPVTFADRADTLVPITDYFKTNNSALNGKDVLAGSPLHNVTYWNSLKTSDSQYKDVPVNLLTGTSAPAKITGKGTTDDSTTIYLFAGSKHLGDLMSAGDNFSISFDWSVPVSGSSGTFNPQFNAYPFSTNLGPSHIPISSGSGHYSVSASALSSWTGSKATGIQIRLDNVTTTITISNMKFGTTASPWSPNPADPEYYEATDVQRSVISNDNYPYVTLPSMLGVNMIDGQLSIYNLLMVKYAGLLNTYDGSTSYDKVKSLISDTNVSLGITVNTDSPISINGANISKGKQSVIIDKSSVVYTASDIYIPVVMTGTNDTNIHYLVANINVNKHVPGLGINLVSQQIDTTISNA